MQPNLPNEVKVFLQFYYPEVKDLVKQFLTLSTTVLVFTITFSEKILDFQKATEKSKFFLISAWVFLLLDIILSGIGLYLMFCAGEAANGGIIYKYSYDYKELARQSYICLDLAGICFGVSLLCIISTVAIKFFKIA